MVHTYHTMYEDYVHYIGGGHIISKNMAREFSSAFCNTAMAVIAPTHKTEQLLSGYGVTKPISIITTGNSCPAEIPWLKSRYPRYHFYRAYCEGKKH